MQVQNVNNKFVLKLAKGEDVTVQRADDAAAPAAGGPTDANKTTAQGSTSTIPVDGSTPPAAGGGAKVDETHRNWHSIGDPHVRMGNENFDNQQEGNFVALKSKDGSFEVEQRQEHIGGNNAVTANTAAAVKDGDNVASYDVKTKKLMLNGKEWDGQTQPAGGMKIEKSADGYSITSSKGDVTNIHDRGNYIDLDGKIGPDRVEGEIQGANGTFDNVDTDASHLKRDGTKAGNTDEMINDWRAQGAEDLFNAQAAGGPAAGGPGAIDDDTKKALTDMFGQLTQLTKSLTDIMGKLGIQQPAADGKGGPAPADAAQPAADAAKPADGAAAPQTFEDQKKADAAAAGAAPAAGGPAAAEAAPAADGGWGDIIKALKGLMDMLTQLLAKLGAAPAGAAPAAAAPAADAAKAA